MHVHSSRLAQIRSRLAQIHVHLSRLAQIRSRLAQIRSRLAQMRADSRICAQIREYFVRFVAEKVLNIRESAFSLIFIQRILHQYKKSAKSTTAYDKLHTDL